MSGDAVQVLIWAGGIGFSAVAGLCGVVGYLLSRDSQRRDRRDERNEDEFGRTKDRMRDKQGTQGETLAGVSARVDALHAIVEKVTDAVNRISRLEEWRMAAGDRLDRADTTGREVIALSEQTKTIFKRMDATDEKIDDLRQEQADTPRRTAELLRTMIQPIQRRAANV